MKKMSYNCQQRFSIRKYAIGAVSVMIATVLFGVRTAQADQVDHTAGQADASIVQVTQDINNTPTDTGHVKSNVTVEAGVSANPVTGEDSLDKAVETSSIQEEASAPVTLEETREDLPVTSQGTDTDHQTGELDLYESSSTTESQTSAPTEAVAVSGGDRLFATETETEVSKVGNEIIVKNPEVEMAFPEGNGKYSSNKVVYHDIDFPDDIAINNGDQVIFTLPDQLRLRTSYSVNVYNPINEVVGVAVADPRTNLITTTFNNYFETHRNNKSMNLELDTVFSQDVQDGGEVQLDFDGRVITVPIATTGIIPADETISKWGTQDPEDPTIMNWAVRLNYARRVLNNLKIIDTWSDNQRYIDGSLTIHYVDSVEPWVDSGVAMHLIQSFSHDDTHFELNLNRLDRMIYIWYKSRLTTPLAESTDPTNHIDVTADDITDGYSVIARLVGGRGQVTGSGYAHFDLTLQKSLEGRPLKDGEFTFKLINVTDPDNPIEVAQASNDASGQIVFSNLEASHAGVYHYQVVEVAGSEAELVYDPMVANISVTVTSQTVNNQPDLTATVTYPDDIEFNNKLASPTKAHIRFNKTLTKSGVTQDIPAGRFQFVLKDASGQTVETVGNRADGQIVFRELTFDKVGTYHYTVQEVVGTDSDLIYDTMVATVAITVNRNGDALVSTVVMPADTSFDNTVKDLEVAKAQFHLTKVLAGRDLKAGEFTFVLKDQNGQEIDRTSNTADGQISFKEMTYDSVGTYTYTIEEVKGTDPAITYDQMMAKVTVHVTKTIGNQKNVLVSMVSLPADTEFNNTYTPPTAAKYRINFNKALAGRDLKGGEFTFVLKDQNGQEIDRTSNLADGQISFKELTYDSVGTYTYTVSEVKGSDPDLVYDDMIATVRVMVTKEGNTYVSMVETPMDTEFNNRVKATKPASVRFELSKVLAGRKLQAGEFSFVLKDQAGNILQTVTNDADGRILFDALNFDTVGSYIYTVEEIKGNSQGIVYDSMVARYQVTVTKTIGDDENLLVASTILPIDREFNNSYRPPMVPPTPPVPNQPGKPVTPSPSSSRRHLPRTGDTSGQAILVLGLVLTATGLALVPDYRRRES